MAVLVSRMSQLWPLTPWLCVRVSPGTRASRGPFPPGQTPCKRLLLLFGQRPLGRGSDTPDAAHR